MRIRALVLLAGLTGLAACGTKVVDFSIDAAVPAGAVGGGDPDGAGGPPPFPAPFCVGYANPNGQQCMNCYDPWGQPLKAVCSDPAGSPGTTTGMCKFISLDDNLRCLACPQPPESKHCLMCPKMTGDDGCRPCAWDDMPDKLCKQCRSFGKVTADDCDRLRPELTDANK